MTVLRGVKQEAPWYSSLLEIQTSQETRGVRFFFLSAGKRAGLWASLRLVVDDDGRPAKSSNLTDGGWNPSLRCYTCASSDTRRSGPSLSGCTCLTRSCPDNPTIRGKYAQQRRPTEDHPVVPRTPQLNHAYLAPITYCKFRRAPGVSGGDPSWST